MADREPVHHCEQCSAPIYEGDKACFCGDGCAFCVEHAPMLSDVIAEWREDMDSDEPYWPECFLGIDDVAEYVAKLEADLAEKGDRKMVDEV